MQSAKSWSASKSSRYTPKIETQKVTNFTNDTAIYFSLTNPNQAFSYSQAMMHGMNRDRNKVPTKEFWLVYGKNLEHKNLTPSLELETFYYDTQENQKEMIKQSTKGTNSYKIEVPFNGYYNIYAKNERVQNGKNIYRVAKFEYLNGNHGSEERYTQEVKKRVTTQKLKIDLLRVKTENEDSFFYRHSMGDELTFQALFEGKPLAHAMLTLTMQSGWSKHIQTDENGSAKFHIIRDYFPKASEFNKRYQEEMLLTLNYEPNDTEQYILSYPLSVSPNESDYVSSAYALLLITFTLILCGFIIYRFRKNRTKPFNELRYEE